MKKLLRDYLPDTLKDVLEFQIIMDSGQSAADRFSEALEDLLNDQFVDTATETGVARYESIFNIIPKDTYTLDERKFTIKVKMNEQLPFTIKMLKRQLAMLCGDKGYSIELDSNKYFILIKVELIAKNSFNDVAEMIKRVVPANMLTEVRIIYNQHKTLGKFTHRYLSGHTHNEIRNEVLNGNQ